MIAGRLSRTLCALGLVWSLFVLDLQAQDFAKYGSSFLESGVGARALAMGGTHTALARDVTAGYWNAAGLSNLQYPQAAYMHDERFAGIVKFDYGSIAFPINNRSTFGIAFIRSGVDDIPNTWNAWDPIRDQPLPNPENYITRFSATDYAFYFNYARAMTETFSLGVTGKVIRRSVGRFQRGWGYSFDLAAQYQVGRFLFGANIQDATTMLVSWSVNEDRLRPLAEVFGDQMPEGGTELYHPVAKLGTGYVLPIANDGLTNLVLGADLDLRFDGRQAFALNSGDVSFHPRLGTELNIRNILALRAGVGQFEFSELDGTTFTPSVGAGLNLRQITLDYGFGDFSGTTSDLGMSHRISLMVTLEQPRLKREIR
ncbi:MAG: PorV/PorQ family protein [Bacteroidota bacterium]